MSKRLKSAKMLFSYFLIFVLNTFKSINIKMLTLVNDKIFLMTRNKLLIKKLNHSENRSNDCKYSEYNVER